MIGVGQDNTDVKILSEITLCEPLHCCVGAHGHEDRCLDCSVRGVEEARARTS